jgi:hypothetical protein
MGQMAEDGEFYFLTHGHEMFELPERERLMDTLYDIRFGYAAHDGMNPAPGDDEQEKDEALLEELADDEYEEEDDNDDDDEDDDDPLA